MERNEISAKLVKQAIKLYREIRKDIRSAVPFWPIGLSGFGDEFTSLGLRNDDGSAYIAVWRREGDSGSVTLPVGYLSGRQARAECIYPSFADNRYEFADGALTADMAPYTARLFKITPDDKEQ